MNSVSRILFEPPRVRSFGSEIHRRGFLGCKALIIIFTEIRVYPHKSAKSKNNDAGTGGSHQPGSENLGSLEINPEATFCGIVRVTPSLPHRGRQHAGASPLDPRFNIHHQSPMNGMLHKGEGRRDPERPWPPHNPISFMAAFLKSRNICKKTGMNTRSRPLHENCGHFLFHNHAS